MSSPLPGTSPCTAATVTSRSALAVHGTRAGTASRATSPTRQSAATLRLPSPATGPLTSHASSAPNRARRKLTPTAPAYGSASATGVSTTPNASRPHGIPPSGQPLRHTSIAVHAAANHSGQSRCRWRIAESAPVRP